MGKPRKKAAASVVTWVAKAIDEVDEFTPATGYNVVGVDTFELPGEGLYLVGHYKTQKGAERARAAHERESGNPTHVYGPDE